VVEFYYDHVLDEPRNLLKDFEMGLFGLIYDGERVALHSV